MVTTGIEGSDYINASYVNVSTVMATANVLYLSFKKLLCIIKTTLFWQPKHCDELLQITLGLFSPNMVIWLHKCKTAKTYQ